MVISSQCGLFFGKEFLEDVGLGFNREFLEDSLVGSTEQRKESPRWLDVCKWGLFSLFPGHVGGVQMI